MAVIVNQSAPFRSSAKVANYNTYAQGKTVTIQPDVQKSVDFTYYRFEVEWIKGTYEHLFINKRGSASFFSMLYL